MIKKISLLATLCCSSTAFALCNTNMNQTNLNICSMNEYKKADQDLNKIYAAYTAKLNKTQKMQVKLVQLNWIKYKESDCKYEASKYEGGSIQPLIINSCLTKKTKLRTQELKEYLAEDNG